MKVLSREEKMEYPVNPTPLEAVEYCLQEVEGPRWENFYEVNQLGAEDIVLDRQVILIGAPEALRKGEKASTFTFLPFEDASFLMMKLALALSRMPSINRSYIHKEDYVIPAKDIGFVSQIALVFNNPEADVSGEP